MHYHIDTIPVWDAIKLEGECPLCALRRKQELLDVDRYLGGSVMEPDTRVRVNEKGFCSRHQVLLYAQKNRLGHALMMHTHLKETMAKLDALSAQALDAAKKSADSGLVKRVTKKTDGREALKQCAADIHALTDKCILCESIEENMNRYVYTFLHLYKTEEGFRKAIASSKGLCLDDMAVLMNMAEDVLSGDMLVQFIQDLTAAEKRNLEKLEKDLEGFTLKFDYRNADKPWGDSRDALERAVNKLQGWCLGAEPNPKEK